MHILQLLRMKDQRGWLIAGVACVSPRSPERPESHHSSADHSGRTTCGHTAPVDVPWLHSAYAIAAGYRLRRQCTTCPLRDGEASNRRHQRARQWMAHRTASESDTPWAELTCQAVDRESQALLCSNRWLMDNRHGGRASPLFWFVVVRRLFWCVVVRRPSAARSRPPPFARGAEA